MAPNIVLELVARRVNMPSQNMASIIAINVESTFDITSNKVPRFLTSQDRKIPTAPTTIVRIREIQT